MSKRVSVDILKAKVAPVNCKVTDGGVIPAASPVLVGSGVPEGIIYACRAESAGRFFVCTATDAFVSVRGGDFTRLNALAGGSPFLVEEISDGVPRAVLINGENAVAHTGSEFRGVYTGVNLAAGVMRCGRLFAADGQNPLLLRWSGEGGVEDWEEKLNGAGWLLLDPERGEILNLVNFGEKLVIVRKYGLTVMDAFGNPENFSAGITQTEADGIYKNTAVVVGGKLYFCTASGLWRFDGSALEHALSGLMEEPRAAVGFAGKYYLACANGVLCYDSADGASYLIDIVADGICAAECVYLFNSSAYKLDGGGNYSFTAELDFGSGKDKTITEIFVGGRADLTVRSGEASRTFANACGTVRPRLRGKSFTVTVAGTDGISALTATAEVMNGI